MYTSLLVTNININTEMRWCTIHYEVDLERRRLPYNKQSLRKRQPEKRKKKYFFKWLTKLCIYIQHERVGGGVVGVE